MHAGLAARICPHRSRPLTRRAAGRRAGPRPAPASSTRLHRLGGLAAFADDLHLRGVGAEHGLQPVEHHLVVVDDHQPHRRGDWRPSHARNGTQAGHPLLIRPPPASPGPPAGATAAATARWPAPRCACPARTRPACRAARCRGRRKAVPRSPSPRSGCPPGARSPWTCSASTGRPSESLISFRCTVRRSSSVSTWDRSGWPMVGRSRISADSGIAARRRPSVPGHRREPERDVGPLPLRPDERGRVRLPPLQLGEHRAGRVPALGAVPADLPLPPDLLGRVQVDGDVEAGAGQLGVQRAAGLPRSRSRAARPAPGGPARRWSGHRPA